MKSLVIFFATLVLLAGIMIFNINLKYHNKNLHPINIQLDSLNSVKYFDTINYKDYTLKVVGFPIGVISKEISEKFQYRNLVSRQEIQIRKEGQLLSTIALPTPKTFVKLKNGQKYYISNSLIDEIGIVKGEKGFYFYVSGFDGCNTCESYIGLISEKGNLEVLYFSDSKRKKVDEIGSLQNCLDKINFSINDFYSQKFRINKLFDPLKEFKGI
jgi:hypothetical protein